MVNLNEDTVNELVEAIEYLLEQFPESDLGYPTIQIDWEGDMVEGHVDDATMWALDQVKTKIAELKRCMEAS